MTGAKGGDHPDHGDEEGSHLRGQVDAVGLVLEGDIVSSFSMRKKLFLQAGP